MLWMSKTGDDNFSSPIKIRCRSETETEEEKKGEKMAELELAVFDQRNEGRVFITQENRSVV